MLTKATVVIFGAVIASAVTALPFTSPEAGKQTEPRFTHSANVKSLAGKGDRLRVVGESCRKVEAWAVCADIFGVSGAPFTVIYQRQIGESMSVLVPMPVLAVAARK